MLSIWLENKHPEVLKRYNEDQDCPPGMEMELSDWAECFEIDIYLQYVEGVIKPTEVLKALLCGRTISAGDHEYRLNVDGQLCTVFGEDLIKALFIDEMYFGDFNFVEFVEFTKDTN